MFDAKETIKKAVFVTKNIRLLKIKIGNSSLSSVNLTCINIMYIS